MRILLTNDDGIHAGGLRTLFHTLVRDGHEVLAVAPETEQSGVSSSITLRQPLRVREVRDGAFHGQGVGGTPVDCVKLAITSLLHPRPDLVVSGVNAGSNLGTDVLYSGTVGAAVEAALLGVPALAVSRRMTHDGELVEHDEQEAAATYTARFISRFDWTTLPSPRVLNLNFPAAVTQARGLRVCPLSSFTWADSYVRREDPRGRPYWWLDGTLPPLGTAPVTDSELVREGWVTLTPLRLDLTDAALTRELACFAESLVKSL